MVHFSHLYMTTGKAIALVIWAFVGKVMSLLFNMLSRFVIALLPRSKCLLISWQQSPSTVILEPKKIKSVIASTSSPSFCHEVMGPDAMILVFWMLSFKPAIAAAFELAGQRAERSLSLMSHSFTPAFLKKSLPTLLAFHFLNLVRRLHLAAGEVVFQATIATKKETEKDS